MGKEKLKSLLTAFSPDGDCLAILSPDGSVKVWNTGDGTQIGEWKETNEPSGGRISCIACSFIGKMRRKQPGTCLIALGTDSGDVSVVNISLGKVQWRSSNHHPGGIASISFRKKEGRLHVIGTRGEASELILEDGKAANASFKLSKKSVLSAACLSDDKIIVGVGHKIRVVSLHDGEELAKFSTSLDSLQCLSSSEDATFVVASGDAEKRLQVWKCDFETRDVNSQYLPMKHHPLRIHCRNGLDGEDGFLLLSVTEAGVVYLWNLKSFSDEASPTRISIKDDTNELESDTNGRAKRNRISVITARIHALEPSGQVKVLISFGSVDSPQFTTVDISTSGEDVVINAGDITSRENGVRAEDGASKQNKKSKKKRAASDMETATEAALIDDGRGDPKDGIQIDDDPNEPTMGEKLANLSLSEAKDVESRENFSAPAKPPSADSVYVLLKQALHADDRALLTDCLFRQDEKVIANSVALLNPSDVLKLLQSLVSMIQSRGAVLACTLPWLRSLLLQHASELMSQESSLITLNTLYQLIQSRVSTFNQTLKLSSSLDLLYAGALDMGLDENEETIAPAIFEDKDGSDEEESAEAMDIESGEDEEPEPQIFSDISDFDEME
ncbi:OLC1v1037491C2 [Oldenlandia corymbosa var. corymbosa]|uniref:OLC1v1037491C2 n=1 Tax=Oldenlandia corymbosa var. corymbosa TaxID=529605 RepID=A0AAV1E1I1_OLDCO|nr:OLC1v1037491C2 [Oldenlandia corymbosa var. corymbosa]